MAEADRQARAALESLAGAREGRASAEARLAAAQADVTVARAAMLPKITLTASLGSGADLAADLLRTTFYNLSSGRTAPIASIE